MVRGELEASSRPIIYSIVAFLGMLIAVIGSFHKYHDFLELGRWDRLKRAVSFSNMQGLLVAFLMFMAYFLVKDLAISRAFLSFFIVSQWILLILLDEYLVDILFCTYGLYNGPCAINLGFLHGAKVRFLGASIYIRRRIMFI